MRIKFAAERVFIVLLAVAALGCLSRPAVAADGGESSSDDPKVIYKEDIVYGRIHGAGLLADIAYPKTTIGKFPAIISVHGGRWRGGHKKDRSAITVQQWAEFGFFAMSIDYRLVGASPVPACYQDFQCAIRFVHAHAREYRIDTNRIFLIGQSAGGHLTSLAATIGDGPWPRTGGWDDASNDFAAAISVAACYELPTLSWGEIWTPATGDPLAARKEASPVYHVSKDMKPIMIMHSDDDRSVPIANALLMVEALKKAGARHTVHHYPDHGHMGITQEVIDRSLEFIEEVSKGE